VTRDPRAQRTLRYSILDGIGYSIMVGAGETYFIPYGIFLGASNAVIGLLVAFPICIGSLSQFISERLRLLLGSRKRLILLSVTLQVLTLVPMACINWLSSEAGTQSLLLLASVCAYFTFGLVLGPSWSSLMGDLVAENQRGQYFGTRNRAIQLANFLSFLTAGLILYFFKRAGMETEGFIAIFCLAVAARLLSLLFLFLHWDPPTASVPHGRTISMVIETLRGRDHRPLILYLSMINFCAHLSAAFFSTYMLRPPEQHGLQWSYGTYTAILAITMLFKFFFLTLWGRASDRFGARKCLTLAGWIVASLPLFWLFPRGNETTYLLVICFVQALGGFAWAGHELCSFNILLDAAEAPDRPRLVAAMNIVNGLAIFIGSSIGAAVVSALNGPLAGSINPFLGVFLLSSILRVGVCFALLPGVREIRQVEAISYRSLLFRVTGFRGNAGPVLRFFLLPGKREPAPLPERTEPQR